MVNNDDVIDIDIESPISDGIVEIDWETRQPIPTPPIRVLSNGAIPTGPDCVENIPALDGKTPKKPFKK
jgi:hypothetical protein